VYGALIAGSEQGLTVEDNMRAFGELGFAPHVAGASSQRDLATTVMGQPISRLGSPNIPEKIDLKSALRFAPEALGRPRWLASFAKTGRIPDLTVPNMAHPGEPAPTFFGAYGEWMQTPLPGWEDVRWLREQWNGPFMLKGVTRVDDARRGRRGRDRDLGVHHGGNNLDGTPASIRALPAVTEVVGGSIEIVLDVLRGGIDSVLLGLGHSSIHDLTPATS
jgi:pre-mycofactocin synthase